MAHTHLFLNTYCKFYNIFVNESIDHRSVNKKNCAVIKWTITFIRKREIKERKKLTERNWRISSASSFAFSYSLRIVNCILSNGISPALDLARTTVFVFSAWPLALTDMGFGKVFDEVIFGCCNTHDLLKSHYLHTNDQNLSSTYRSQFYNHSRFNKGGYLLLRTLIHTIYSTL